MIPYELMTLRNKGYVSSELQERIRNTRILNAGIGMGSLIPSVAVRIGFTKLILADGDVVEPHNLNRQDYVQEDVGLLKVTALARRLRAINPEISLVEHADWITQENVGNLVNQADLIFDTIDFLDLSAITALHDEANKQKIPIISAVSMAFGGGAIYFPPAGNQACGFRRLFGLPDFGPVENASYVKHFGTFIARINSQLDPTIAIAMSKALEVMEDGTPCPAPHVSVGAYSAAALAVTMAVRILNHEQVVSSPKLLVASMSSACTDEGIDLTP